MRQDRQGIDKRQTRDRQEKEKRQTEWQEDKQRTQSAQTDKATLIQLESTLH